MESNIILEKTQDAQDALEVALTQAKQVVLDAALIEACKAGDLNAAKKALNNGASVNYHDANGVSGIEYALLHEEIVELLVKQEGITQETLDKGLMRGWGVWESGSLIEGSKPVWRVNSESAKLLLEAGANPNYKHAYTQYTTEYAIDFAVREYDILKLFIETGKLTKETIDHGLSVGSKDVECTELLLKAGATVNSEWELQHFVDQPKNIQLFIENLSIEQASLNTALESAIQRYCYSLESLKSEMQQSIIDQDYCNDLVKHSDSLLESAKLLRKAGADFTIDTLTQAGQINPEAAAILKQHMAEVLAHEAAPAFEQPKELNQGMEGHEEVNSGANQ